MAISELYRKSGRLGIANFARDTAAVNAKRRWYVDKAVGQFGISSSGAGPRRAQGIWKMIEENNFPKR